MNWFAVMLRTAMILPVGLLPAAADADGAPSGEGEGGRLANLPEARPLAAPDVVSVSPDSTRGIDRAGLSDTAFRYDAGGKRNPFVPLILQPTPEPMDLSAVEESPEGTEGVRTASASGGIFGLLGGLFSRSGSGEAAGAVEPQPEPIIPPELIVNSVLIPSGRPAVACVNQRLVHVGDVIDQAEVIYIRQGEVVFRYKGQDFVMTASQPE